MQLFTSAFLLAELKEVLQRGKLAKRLRQANVRAGDLVAGFATLARIVKPATIESVVIEDPPDDEVIACAVAASASAIVSGDSHLLKLQRYGAIEIRTAPQFLAALVPGQRDPEA